MIALAATLLLLRDRGTRLEVLMMRRGSALRFMGGMWVFPGGRVDPSDCTPAAAASVGESATAEPPLCALDGSPLPDALALGLRIAACRETYEEAGILLARRRDGRCPDGQQLCVLQAERERVTRSPQAFLQLLADTGLLLDTGQLVSWGHWITPSHERTRFDTRFFATGWPAGQPPSACGQESTELQWLTPQDACRAAARGEMQLAPPTLLTLEDLDEAYARHRSVATLLAAERGRPTPPVMPRIRSEGSTTHVLMPWDPAYAETHGEGTGPATAYPPHLTRRRSELVFPRAAPGR
jgi:8-oxo-dGTP pyrophosphatase MutT (NUDIX family)